MKSLFRVLVAAVLGFVLAACSQQQPQPIMTQPITIDKTLQKKLEITRFASRYRENGLTEVQFGVKNKKEGESVDFLYHVEWFDKDGFKIKSMTDTFVPVHLGPQEEKIIDVVAISPKAVSYKIVISDYDKNKERIIQ